MDRQKGKVREVSEAELKQALADERRSDPRLPARLEVEVPLSSWEQVRRVFTTNISKGGLLFTMTSPAAIPSTVELVVTLPDGSKVSLQSEVRHVARREGSTDFDVGVQFAALEPAAKQAFEDALKQFAHS